MDAQGQSQVTLADLERQLGQMVVALMNANKIIEAQAQRIAELTPPAPKPEAEQEK